VTGKRPPRAPPRPQATGVVRDDYLRAYDGQLPAEALPTRLRWRLVAELHRAGWSDQQIAELTKLTEYTTARIRAGMGLKPNGGARG
jgi:hypothetical protein